MKRNLLTLIIVMCVTYAHAQTWVQKLILPSGTGYFNALHFPSATNGWAAGIFYGPPQSSLVYYTTDGGQTWAQRNPISNFVAYDVFFIDNQTGWLGGSNGKLYKTVDNGATWTQQTTGITDDIKSVYFTSATEGWFASMNGVYKTTNGGTNWTFNYSYPAGRKIHFTNTLTGYVIGMNGIAKTDDGGINWISTALTPFYNGIAFPDNNNGFIGGSSGRFSKTTDGGNTWTTTTLSSTGDIYATDFVDASTGWISTSSVIRKTVDGGANWVTERSGANFSDIQAFSATDAWAIGYNGTSSSIYHRLACSNSTSTLSLSGCDQIVFHGTTYTNSGTFTQAIPNAAGCDSIVTLNVSITSSSASAPVVSGLSGVNSTSACAGNAFTITAGSSPSNTHQWTLPPDWTITAGANTNVITGTYGQNAGTITVIATNGCIVSSAPFTSSTISPFVGPPVAPTAINISTQPACINGIADFSVANATYGTEWAWSSNEWAGGGSNYNPYGSFVASTGNGSVTVVLNNACGSSAPYTQAFIFNLQAQLPVPVITQTGNTLTTTETAYQYCWVAYEGGARVLGGGPLVDTCILGSAGMSFTPPVDGEYTLTISTPNGCSTESAPFTVTGIPVSIKENEVLAFGIFPNPASTSVALNSVVVGSLIKVVDITGKLIYAEKVLADFTIIETSSWSNGMYFIHIENKGEVAQKKLIISK